jgi:site-specific recombinase XerD
MKAGKAFFRYLVDRGVCETNPFAAVPYPRLPEHVSRNLLNEAQMGNLLNRLGQFNRKKHQRDRLRDYKVHVVSEVLYASGLRISEAAGLLPEQIDTSQRLIFVAEGKNRKSRIAFLSRYAAEVLSVYMSYGRGRILGGYRRTWGDRVFGTHPERLSSLVNREVGGCCRELGIPVITSHGFRHSLGTHLHRAGCDMRYIQMILGHESLGSTQVYTAVDRSELRKILDLYHGR